jgi:HD superfamily phosphohydrolase
MTEQRLVRALSDHFDTIVRDPVWGDIHMDEALFSLFCAPEFNILDGIRQLGPAAQLYPGATHTRKAHSLGVYSIARRMAISLAERGQIDFATVGGLRGFLVAALCHDLGHFPFAHSLKELPLAAHEAIAGDMVLREPLSRLVEGCGADPVQVAAIIDTARILPDEGETLLFRSILSGVLDPDKIDYLTRDAFHCGVPYGIQDADYILRRILVDRFRLAVDSRGELSVEALLFSKYQMYRAVYWHPAVRAATSMVKKSVLMELAAGRLLPDSLYGLDDAGFRRLVDRERERNGSGCFVQAADVFAGDLFESIHAVAFDPGNPLHADLAELDRRLEAEAAFAEAAGIEAADVVIDIPEPVSFETDLVVLGEGGGQAFTDRSAVFGRGSIPALVDSLRKIRVYARKNLDRPDLKALARELLA